MKKVIRKTAPAAIAYKVVNATKVLDAVLNGTTLATQKTFENAVTDILTKRKEPVKTFKRKLPETSATTKKDKNIKIDVANLINGSGIARG